MAIPANAVDVDAAYAYIDAMISPEVNARVATNLISGTVNSKAFDKVGSKALIYDYSILKGGTGALKFEIINPPIEAPEILPTRQIGTRLGRKFGADNHKVRLPLKKWGDNFVLTSDLKDYKQRKANSRAAGLMLAPALCYYILFFAGPVIVLMIFSVFTFRNLLWVPKLTLDNYFMALTDPVFAKILVRTFYLASWVTLLTLLVAYPFTFIITFVLPSRREFFTF